MSEREALVARVRYVNEFLNPDAPIARRGTVDGIATLRHGDITALCAEVERLTRERDSAVEAFDNLSNLQRADRAEVLRLTAEVERLRELVECKGCGRGIEAAIGAVVRGGVACCPDCTTLTVGQRNHIRSVVAARTTGGRDAE